MQLIAQHKASELTFSSMQIDADHYYDESDDDREDDLHFKVGVVELVAAVEHTQAFATRTMPNFSLIDAGTARIFRRRNATTKAHAGLGKSQTVDEPHCQVSAAVSFCQRAPRDNLPSISRIKSAGTHAQSIDLTSKRMWLQIHGNTALR